MSGDSREDRGVSWWPRAHVRPQDSDEPYRLGCDRWCVLDGFTLGQWLCGPPALGAVTTRVPQEVWSDPTPGSEIVAM